MRDPVDWPTVDPLAHRVDATPDATAIVDAASGASLSCRAFDERVSDLAADLRRWVTEGDRVPLLLSTGVPFATATAAIWRLGGVAVPLDIERPADDIAAQLDRVEPTCVVCASDHEPLAAGAAVPVHSVDEDSHEGNSDQSADDNGVEPASWHRDDDALVAFTSGTTGEPKGVRLTMGNLVASATASAFRLGVAPDDRWLIALPMYHLGGLSPLVRATLYGTTVVLQREFDAERTAAVIADRDVTCVSLVPTQLRRLLDTGWSPPASLRFVLLGGAPADDDLLAECRQRDVPVCPTYGLTETASQVATALPETAFSHEGTVGQPLVFTEVTILDDGTPADTGQTGEIVVDGPTVTPGYLDDDRTAAAFGSEGLHTGDLGYVDADGRLWVVGRVDDRIVSGGENVAPDRVAGAITEHPAVRDAVVVGIPDEEWGQRVAAGVVPAGEDDGGDAADGRLTAEGVRDHCRDRLAPYEVPKTVVFVEELPRTASGTVDRDAVRAMFEEG